MAERSDTGRPAKRVRAEVQLTLYDLFKRAKAKAAPVEHAPASVALEMPAAVAGEKALITLPATESVPACVESSPEAVSSGSELSPASAREPMVDVLDVLVPHKELLPYESFKETSDFLTSKQKTYAPNPEYLARHPEIKPRMRSVLMDWLIEVSEEFSLHRETYHAAANLVDRFLSSSAGCHKNEVQLIGVTCLFLASKTLEIHAPSIGQFAELTDGACTAENILREEVKIMQTLEWRITPPTLPAWVVALLRSPEFKYRSRQLYLFTSAMEILDLASLDFAMLQHTPAYLAAAAIAIVARDSTLFTAIGYDNADIRPAIDFLYPYANVVSHDLVSYKANPNHLLQLHNVNLDRYDRGHRIDAQYNTPPTNARPRAPAAPRKHRSRDE